MWTWAGPTAALAGLLSWWFFATPLRPWPDQGLALEAAVRHAQGEGLVTSRPGQDLAHEDKARLTYFPPFYPLLVSGLLRVGLDVEASVKGINALAMIAGVWAWCRLLLGQVQDTRIRLLYCVLLPVAAGGVVPKGGTTDYLFWAAFPLWCAAMLASDERLRSNFGGAMRQAGWAGLLGAILVGVRWAALFLVLTVASFWLWPLIRSGDRLRRLALIAGAATPPLAMYLALSAVNRHLSGGHASLMSYVEQRWDWQHLLTLYPFDALFAVPVGLEPLLSRLWRAIDPSRSAWVWGIVFRVLLPGVALALLVVAVWRSKTLRQRMTLVRLASATTVALLGFLAFMSVRHSWSFADWTYLEEARYFRPVWPLAALLWLALVDTLPARSRLRWGALLVLTLGGLYLLQAQARWTVARMRPEESWELVQRVRAIENEPGLHVVFDNDVSDYTVSASPRLRARLYPTPEEAASLRTSAPVHLWLVWRPHEPTAYIREVGYDRKRFQAASSRFGAHLVWRSSAGAYELYSAGLVAAP